MKIISSKLDSLLLKIRVSKGYSQTYVARHLGVSQKVYSKIESGKSKLDLIRFLKIAECLETHPIQILNKLIEGNPFWDNIEPKERVLVSELEKLSSEITSMRALISHQQNMLNLKLDKILEHQESSIAF